MFDLKDVKLDDVTGGYASPEAGGQYIRMERPGSCRFQGCSCQRFLPKSPQDAQFCEGCGHSRSMHIH